MKGMMGGKPSKESGMMDMKCAGRLEMNGKNTLMGKPRKTMGGKKTDMPMNKEKGMM